MDKVDKYYLLGVHNCSWYISCIKDLCINYMMDNIIILRHRYFQAKLNLYQYQRMQKQFNPKLNFVLMIVQNSKFQLQKELHHKIQSSLYRYQGICMGISMKRILRKIKLFQKTIYPILIIELIIKIIQGGWICFIQSNVACSRRFQLEGNKKYPEQAYAFDPVFQKLFQACHQEFETSINPTRIKIIEKGINQIYDQIKLRIYQFAFELFNIISQYFFDSKFSKKNFGFKEFFLFLEFDCQNFSWQHNQKFIYI
ncbi:unnamed protein product [Paramecium octaurelia]|uniref:Uncharacterized protein n=1 Tax=Paramecium octaurelia TaxID=43137 RepID=A0A8S1YJC1_PAROT|nr:unnamed protein product [Paramecium octaurelia]